MRRYLHDQLLRDADVFSMAHSIETRIPFLDHELACRAACLPAAAKRANGVHKPALLAALPHPIVAAAAHRKKMGFTFPIGQWLAGNLEPMREIARRSDALDAREASRLFRAFGAGRLPVLRRIVCSSDRAIVDRCREWFDLARQVIANRMPQARIVSPGLEESAQAGA